MQKYTKRYIFQNLKIFPDGFYGIAAFPSSHALENQTQTFMKSWKFLAITGSLAGAALLLSFSLTDKSSKKVLRPYPKGCVFRTVMGEESADSMFIFKSPERVQSSIERGLDWLLTAQNRNGGWGAGSHARQDVMDPHAVEADPATTSMVAMALLRTGTTLKNGHYSGQLNKALQYLLQAAENAPVNSLNITDQTGTQIQTKLGANIDVILASQFFSNLMDQLDDTPQLKARVKRANEICVAKIQRAQSNDGSIQGSGWAGVLQSSFAPNALESAMAEEITIDEKALDRARDFQKNNLDTQTGEVKTEMGAGVVLYSVSGSSRASAKEARKVKEEMERAKKDGRLAQNAPASVDNLRKIGFQADDAMKYATAYEVYNSAKVQAQREDVLEGFGNNGGEEFLIYLQTGESMVIGKDTEWTKWYDNTSGRLIKIQNNDGSWNGHHCITSPVFCTATCLLILSVNNDVDRLVKQGEMKN
jgi:hypothetical protein